MDQSPLSAQLRAAHVLRDETRFGALIAHVENDAGALRSAALAEIDEVSRTRPDLVVPHRNALIGVLQTSDSDADIRLIAMTLARVKLDPKQRSKTVPLLERALASKNAATALAALGTLVDFAREDRRYGRAFKMRTASIVAAYTPALRVRAQRILARLETP